MAIDTIIEGVVSIVGEIFAHSLGPLFHGTGWVVLKVVTLGNYPPRARRGEIEAPYYSRVFVSFIGFSLWTAAAIYLVASWL